MKKCICFILIVVLLLGMVPAAMAAGNAYMSGPDIVRAGDTIAVSFSAGGGIYGGSGSLSYDPTQLTLQGCSAAISDSWVVEFSGSNFVFYDNSMSEPISDAVIFTATFTVASSVTEGAVISVSANNVILSDGEQDMSIGTVTYSGAIAAPLSDNCRLAGLTVENASISPSFSADVLEYFVSVPYEISALRLTAVAEHVGAKLYVENPELAVAATTDVRVTVTAENGAARTYVIHVSRPQDPNYVPSANAKLRELFVEGYALSPMFSGDVTKYYVWLPYETERVSVKATADDSRASMVIGEQTILSPGQGTDIAVTVTAEDGTQLTYTVTAVRAPAYEDTERYLGGERETEPAATEPAVEATEEPVAEPTTQPTTVPSDVPQEEGGASQIVVRLEIMIAGCAGCAVVGAAVGMGVVLLIKKRKNAKA